VAPSVGFREIVGGSDLETLERDEDGEYLIMRCFSAASLILLSLGCGGEGGTGGGTVSIRVDRPAFDATRAFEDLETQVAFGPRIPGSEGHALQLAWLESRLLELADTVFLEPFEHVTEEGHELSLTNVVARFASDDGGRILLLTHWDTRPRSDRSPDEADHDIPVPGANDGASGTAVLLELARMFKVQPPSGGVDLLFSDGEDYGPTTADMFLGARHYVTTLSGEDSPAFAILLDMVGDVDPRFPMETYSVERAPQIVQRVWRIAADLGYRRYFPMDESVRVVDDHLQLNDAGIPTIDLIDFDYGPGNRFWHTPRDTPENTSAQTLLMVGDVVAEVVYRNR
jgi:glutaminyl-peptide cyclotransferase